MKARLVNWFAGASAPFLAKAAMIAGAAVLGLVLSMSFALWLQTHRLGNAQERIGALQSGIQQCAEANRSQMQTLEAIRETQAENESRRVAAIEAQREAAQRARQLQQELDQRGDDDIRIVERSQGDCMDVLVPDDAWMSITAQDRDQD